MNLTKLGIWLGLLMSSMPPTVPAATYHVARDEPGASDANDGLSPIAGEKGSGPWLTIHDQMVVDRKDLFAPGSDPRSSGSG